jgi:hypothetical protein
LAQAFAFNRAAKPGTSPAKGKDQRGEGGGLNTGAGWSFLLAC